MERLGEIFLSNNNDNTAQVIITTKAVVTTSFTKGVTSSVPRSFGLI